MAVDLESLAERLRRTSEAARASGEVAEDDRAARDETIWEAEAAGWSQRRIGRATGLSQSTVGAILARQAR